eukprot:c17462_g1_i1.p1 GENE.c17462_g1_i1~~c17462_g1_i1.p1  ORF type:complete len:353 (-),score=76.81 c17462_g1_i1:83-1141(-)
MHPDGFEIGTLLISSLVFFPLQLISSGTAVPAGIFMPSILCGCTLGGLFGKVMENYWFSKVHVGSCALMGAVAMLGGIQRTTMSLCVIMMEGTQRTEYLLPIIFTTVIANFFGNYFNHGVYEISLELKNVPFLDHQIHHQFHVFQARHVMHPTVHVVSLRDTVGNLLHVLQSTTHSGFPVVYPDSNRYAGFILRSQLLSLIDTLAFAHATTRPDSELLLPKAISGSSSSRETQESFIEEDRLGTLHSSATEQERSQMLDLEPVMNVGPHMVTLDCPLSRTYVLFCAMGLRHLVVVNNEHHVVGIITRKDLLRIEKVVRDQHLTFEQKETIVAKFQTNTLEEENDSIEMSSLS